MNYAEKIAAAITYFKHGDKINEPWFEGVKIMHMALMYLELQNMTNVADRSKLQASFDKKISDNKLNEKTFDVFLNDLKDDFDALNSGSEATKVLLKVGIIKYNKTIAELKSVIKSKDDQITYLEKHIKDQLIIEQNNVEKESNKYKLEIISLQEKIKELSNNK